MPDTGSVTSESFPSLFQEAVPGTSHYHLLRTQLIQSGTYHVEQGHTWRIGRTPFPLTDQEASFFQGLGEHLLSFYQGLNRLYFESLNGRQPEWVHRYLDQGKPDELLTYARMNRFRDLLPGVIRPDIIPTEHGMIITELDSVPGGLGLTGSLAKAYAPLGHAIVGGPEGMPHGFATMLRHVGDGTLSRLAIVVSDESEPYRRDMQWMARQLSDSGLPAACIHPKDLRFTERAFLVPEYFGSEPVPLLYRFFELFDLKNIPKVELMMYSAKKGRTLVTPPFKPWLEEKLAFAFIHHPMLEPYWTKTLSPATFALLKRLVPQTWVLDPAPIPPTAVIPGLEVSGGAVADWRQLFTMTQKERRFVVKPSGFSELAWGSRGVSVGHDLPQGEWAGTLEKALEAFPTTPHILQVFHKGRQYSMEYYDERHHEWRTMMGRARLSPYYFVHGDTVTLGGILAAVCPKEKKVIHGMRDAVIVPCSRIPDASAGGSP